MITEFYIAPYRHTATKKEEYVWVRGPSYVVLSLSKGIFKANVSINLRHHPLEIILPSLESDYLLIQLRILRYYLALPILPLSAKIELWRGFRMVLKRLCRRLYTPLAISTFWFIVNLRDSTSKKKTDFTSHEHRPLYQLTRLMSDGLFWHGVEDAQQMRFIHEFIYFSWGFVLPETDIFFESD